jgi:peptidoglycan/xylan/chitin deacetylase (PgdA/CDA1 family)
MKIMLFTQLWRRRWKRRAGIGRRHVALYPLLTMLILLHAGAVRAEISNAVVFMYHRFGEAAYPATNVRLEQFDAHLEHLADAGYQIWPLQRIVDHLLGGRPIPDRTVAITVDDAYLSVYREAWPRLKRRGWPFTVFVSTDAVDQRLPAFMSWEQMREMQRDGVVFANHTASHEYLVRRRAGETPAVWRERIRADIARAQQRLAEELGEPPRLFAYPYGEYDGALAELVSELGYTAFGQHSGAIGPRSDTRALPRFAMAEAYAELADFRTRAASLALPVAAVEPWDPVVKGAAAPKLKVTVEVGDARLSALRCFDQQGETIEVSWIAQGREIAVFTARARRDLPPGRSRYNCTAPSASQPQRYYWFSHPWLRPQAASAPPSADRARAGPRRAPP